MTHRSTQMTQVNSLATSSNEGTMEHEEEMSTVA